MAPSDMAACVISAYSWSSSPTFVVFETGPPILTEQQHIPLSGFFEPGIWHGTVASVMQRVLSRLKEHQQYWRIVLPPWTWTHCDSVTLSSARHLSFLKEQQHCLCGLGSPTVILITSAYTRSSSIASNNLLWTWTHCHLHSLLKEQQHFLYGPGPTEALTTVICTASSRSRSIASMDLDPLSSSQPTQGAGVLPLWMTWTHCQLLSPLKEQQDCRYTWILIHVRSFASPQPTHGPAAYLSMSTSSETANRHTWQAPRYPCTDNSSPYLLFKEQHHCLGFL